MKALLQRFNQWLAGREKREQWLVAGLMVAVTGWCAWLLLVEPAQQTISETGAQNTTAQQRIAELRGQLAELRTQAQINPNEELEARRSQLERQKSRLGNQLAEKAEFVDPETLLVWMQLLLESSEGLSLQAFDTRAEVPFLQSQNQTQVQGTNDILVQVYQHPVSVTLQGNFFAIRDHMEQLSELPVSFYWQGFEYQVTEYPTAVVKLELFTLSYSGEAS